MPAEARSRPWWNYLRFGVRALLIAVLVVGGGLAWIVRSAGIQRAAVAAIHSAGGSVHYDWQWNHGQTTLDGRPWLPRSIVDNIGADYFGHVTDIWLCSSTHDGAIPPIDSFTRLERLIVFGSAFGDGEMAQLPSLPNVCILDLCGTQVSDAGLACLSGSSQLVNLNLALTRVTDAGLAQLNGLKKLACLDLQCTAVTDAGLKHLKGMTSLKMLILNGTEVSRARMKELERALPGVSIYHRLNK
jgi:hypothetical protein